MSPIFWFFTVIAHVDGVIFEAIFGFFDWLKINDFSGARRRKRYLAEAPTSFKADKIPVVLDADKLATLLYDERGFYLKNRNTGKTSSANRKTLRRLSRRGMKGIRSQSLKLTR